MFARIKKSAKYQYLQIVENRREGAKIIQCVSATIGRMDKLQAKDRVETFSIYFEGEGGETIGERGHSRDNRPDLRQMVQ